MHRVNPCRYYRHRDNDLIENIFPGPKQTSEIPQEDNLNCFYKLHGWSHLTAQTLSMDEEMKEEETRVFNKVIFPIYLSKHISNLNLISELKRKSLIGSRCIYKWEEFYLLTHLINTGEIIFFTI